MLAVIPTRGGLVPTGARETVAECGGRAVLIGSGCAATVDGLGDVTRELTLCEVGDFRPAAWSRALAESQVLAGCSIVLPSSPDGRDLAPRLAAQLARPLFAGAISVSPSEVHCARAGGLMMEHITPTELFVATLQPGVRGIGDDDRHATPEIRIVVLEIADGGSDPTLIAERAADAATMDLAEAQRIIAGGAGLKHREAFDTLAAIGRLLQASVGATRVITDHGWLSHEHQIGTTGVIVDPALYLAFGISGAVQHTSGLGQPEHIISVNVDPYCPMMQLADLAIVSDANETVEGLLALLAERAGQ